MDGSQKYNINSTEIAVNLIKGISKDTEKIYEGKFDYL